MEDTAVAKLVAAALLRQKLPAPDVARALREGSGVSQRKLAKAIGVKPSTISRWESGRRRPSDARVDAYAEFLVAVAREMAS